MAATLKSFSDRRLTAFSKETGIAVPQAGNTTILEMNVKGLERLFAEIAVTVQALDAFRVDARAHEDGSYQTLYSTAANYTSPAGLLVGASGDLTVQAAGTSGWLILDVRGMESLRLQASSGNAAGSTVAVYAGCR